MESEVEKITNQHELRRYALSLERHYEDVCKSNHRLRMFILAQTIVLSILVLLKEG